MKRLFLVFVSLLFIAQTVLAADIEVLPTMQSKAGMQNRVWVGTFQLAWNDLMDRLAFGKVKFAEGTPDIANDLNMRAFNSEQLSSKYYYKYYGKITKNTKKQIGTAIRKKFGEVSDILEETYMPPDKDGYIIYAMLKKKFKFVHSFDKLGWYSFKNSEVEYFGVNGSSDERIRKGVTVLFYNFPNEYAVLLDTAENDEVYLYKTSNAKPFNFIYKDMVKKRQLYEGNTEFASIDELKIPTLKFFEEKSFDELTNKRIKGTKCKIDKALETVKFEMNNEGADLKSEAKIVVTETSALPDENFVKPTPRYFNFDDTFVMFIKEKGKSRPYFALRVHDIESFR